MMRFRISSVTRSAGNLVEAAQRRWRRSANLGELAALDAGRLADIGIDPVARDALLHRAGHG